MLRPPPPQDFDFLRDALIKGHTLHYWAGLYWLYVAAGYCALVLLHVLLTTRDG